MAETSSTYKGLCASANCFSTFFKDKLNVIKECDSSIILNNCWTNDASPTANTFGLVLNDGSLIKFTYLDKNCADTSTGIASCSTIDVDVNGFTGPNKLGKDLYKIHITESGLEPFGSNDTNSCSNGLGCAAEVIKGGNF